MLGRRCAVISLAALGGLVSTGPAHARTVWLCHPGTAANPCTKPLTTSVLNTAGKVLRVRRIRAARHPKVDCFYVYPTVSEQPTNLANRHIDPEERSIAQLQASHYSQYCAVYAPMYRQQTLAGLAGGNATPEEANVAYRSVLRAFRAFLRAGHGRGFVLIGHSQGSEILRRVVAEEIDGAPALRRRMLSAQLLGGNIAVAKGTGVGGDFQHVPACFSAQQLGCVVAYSTFGEPVPADAVYGRVNGPFNPGDPATLDVLCTNPADLEGGPAALDSFFPSAGGLEIVGVPPAKVSTPWYELRGAYTGACSDADGAHVLHVDGTPELTPFPDATWGLHLADVNIALGDLLGLVRTETKVYMG
ncbi:MAG: hypothetical protein QOF76_2645 [Solirubrobacteraceae bacterium]|jgi:hypothetical protein|nr:hypothetical protein [Solirubrobacteraceae bacterium]